MATAMREKVTVPLDEAVEVTLQGPGVEQANRAGEIEYRYILAGDQIMWVPPEAHQQIERITAPYADKNRDVRITRVKAGRSSRWHVQDITQQRQPAAQPSYGYGEPAPPTPPVPEPPAAQQPGNTPAATCYYTCLCAAIRAAAAAEKFAAEIKRPLQLDSSDIRAIATTLYIQASGGRA